MTPDETHVNVTQQQIDSWRAFAEQTRTDLFTVRAMIARGQGKAAEPILSAMIEGAIAAGLDMEEGGAARPSSLPPKP